MPSRRKSRRNTLLTKDHQPGMLSAVALALFIPWAPGRLDNSAPPNPPSSYDGLRHYALK